MFKKVYILLFLIGSFFFGFSQTVLSPGDIAIIGFNADNPDEFSFVALVPISVTTVIKFTDNGWLSSGSFRSGEGEATWTANAIVNCGDEVFIDATNQNANTGTVSTTGGFALSSSGDQIIAFQGTSGSPTNIYAINFDGAGVWQANATNSNNSALPSGLTNGSSAVALNENDDGKYNCTVTSVQGSILTAIGNNANWTMSSSRVTLPVNCGFTCVACVLSSEPTVNSSALTFPDTTCNSIDLSWSSGNGANRIVVASTSPIAGTPTDQTTYTANTIFGSGSTIAVGEFVIYNGSGTSVTVTGLAQSTTYYFAIFEYNGAIANCEENYLTSSSLSGNFATPICPIPMCPEITGILVDACGGSIEGINEFFTFENGNTNLAIDSLKATFPSGGAYCNSGCGAQNWTTNPTYVASLNTTAGCAGLFVETDPIPISGKVIVFTGAAPSFNFDFSGLCGSGPYYAVFANNASTSGRFANYNATCSNRTLNVDFGALCSDAATYSRCLLSNTDGDYVTFDAAGNPTYQNDGCTPSTILPITLLYFKGNTLEKGKNLLEWITSSEINNDFFTIERSTDALNFIEIGIVNGAGNSNTNLTYQFTDDKPKNGINYYRLKQTDFNGDFTYSNIFALNNNTANANIFASNNTLQIVLDTEISNGTIEVYDAVGRVIYFSNITSSKKISTTQFNSGIYIVKITTPTNITIKKIKL